MIILRKVRLKLFQRVFVKIIIVEKKGSSFHNKKKSLFVSLLFLSEDLFCKSFFIIQSKLDNKINEIMLINTCATGFSFIDKKFAEIICQTLEIEPQHLTKLKPI